MAEQKSPSERELQRPSEREGSDRDADKEKAKSGRSLRVLPESVINDLENQVWYHGMVTREDIPHILTKKGDFLVRISQVDPDSPAARMVISVYWDAVAGAGNIKHFVILTCTVTGKFYLVKEEMKSTVSGLIRHHMKRGIPLDEKGKGPVIVQGAPRTEWELLHDQVELKEKLGKGAFGEVYKGLLHIKTRDKPQEVAVKSCLGNSSKEQRQAFMKEARIMRQYDHRNVIRLYGVAAEKEPLLLVMELAAGGSLLSHLRKLWPNIKTKEKLRLILDVARGMEYLEKKCCIHRDLAARNCLLDSYKGVKIADFGLSSIARQETLAEGLRLPIKWTAPEAIHQCQFSSKSDVWSFGILVVEVWTGGAEPYPGKPLKEIKKGVAEGLQHPIPESMPPQLSKLLKLCWDLSPHKRPSFANIREYLGKL